MSHLSIEQQRVKLVLERMIAQISQPGDDGQGFAVVYGEELDFLLEELAAEDFFGTEGECDPRGDFRNGNWSMDFVEGID